MGVIKKTILIEDILSAHFDMLPAIEKEVGGGSVIEFKPFFKVGTELEVVDYLKNKESKPYPLIWLVYPTEEDHKKTMVTCDNFTLILSVESNANEMDEDRLQTSYKAILFPLLDNIKKLFRISQSIDFSNDNLKLSKFTYYSNDDSENVITSKWDALRVVFESISFKDKCIKPINI